MRHLQEKKMVSYMRVCLNEGALRREAGPRGHKRALRRDSDLEESARQRRSKLLGASGSSKKSGH